MSKLCLKHCIRVNRIATDYRKTELQCCLACNLHCLSSAALKNPIASILQPARKVVVHTVRGTLCCKTNDSALLPFYTYIGNPVTTHRLSTTSWGHLLKSLKQERKQRQQSSKWLQPSWGWYMSHHYNIALPLFHNKFIPREKQPHAAGYQI